MSSAQTSQKPNPDPRGSRSPRLSDMDKSSKSQIEVVQNGHASQNELDKDQENASRSTNGTGQTRTDFDHDEKPTNTSGFQGGYDALKSFGGQVYSGMAVGGSHTWNYEPGVWKETKEEPDLWKIDYETTKKRAKNAPEGSGAPVGTEYHWLIVAHQYVKKVDANTYETHLVGSKYKLAHKNASSNSWSIPKVQAQRDREIELLDDAKQRVRGLPPVLAAEKVKVEKHEKGQQKLDSLFATAGSKSHQDKTDESKKRKRDV